MINYKEMERVYVISSSKTTSIYVAHALAQHQFPNEPPIETDQWNKNDNIFYFASSFRAPANFSSVAQVIFVYEPLETALQDDIQAISSIQKNYPLIPITAVRLTGLRNHPQTVDEQRINLKSNHSITFSKILPLATTDQSSLDELLAHIQASRKARQLYDKLVNDYVPKIHHLKNTVFPDIRNIVENLEKFITQNPPPSIETFGDPQIQAMLKANLKRLQWSPSSLSNSLVNSALIPLCIAGVAGAAGYALSLGLFTMLAIAAALAVCVFIALKLSGQARTNIELRGGPLAFFAFGHKQVLQASLHVAWELAIMDDEARNPSMY